MDIIIIFYFNDFWNLETIGTIPKVNRYLNSGVSNKIVHIDFIRDIRMK